MQIDREIFVLSVVREQLTKLQACVVVAFRIHLKRRQHQESVLVSKFNLLLSFVEIVAKTKLLPQ